MSKTHSAVILSAEVREELTQWITAHGTPQQIVQRCRIVLLDADGASDVETARALGLSRHTCRRWRQRFVCGGAQALWRVAPGRGRKPDGPRQQRIVEATVGRKPKGQTHWSVRTLARDLGVSPTLVHLVWRAHQLKPHLESTFKVSRDPRFLQKITDVVGLYLNPPFQAIVLCVDEKSPIQALDRTQPGLPLKKGRCGTMTHDYKRNGTTTLFAAMEVLSGKLIGQCQKRHRHQEFIRFLKTLDRQFPGSMALHLVLDNYGTHKTDQVRAWLAKHPRFVLHFIPTSSSWLNLVERWFRELTQKALKRGVFVSVPDLEQAIHLYLEAWNETATPFVWTATVESIMAKITKCRDVLEKIEPGCTLPKRRKKAAINV